MSVVGRQRVAAVALVLAKGISGASGCETGRIVTVFNKACPELTQEHYASS